MNSRRHLATVAVLVLMAFATLACGGASTSTPAAQPTKARAAQPMATCSPVDDVVILIVDEFDAPSKCTPPDSPECIAEKHGIKGCTDDDCWLRELKAKMTADQEARKEGTSCLFFPSVQSHFAGSGALYFAGSGAQGPQKGLLWPPQAHGELVYAQLEQLHQNDNNNPQIRLEKVLASGYTTKSVSNALVNKLGDLRGQCYRRFVLNMSFVIMPCDVMSKDLKTYTDELEKSDYNDLEKQLKALTDVQKLAQFRFGHAFGEFRLYMSNNTEQKATSCDAEPLCNFLDKLPSYGSYGQVISVGSAGNMGDPYPFAPAAWPMVVSVSAGRTDEEVKYSNAGEVQMPGRLTKTDSSTFKLLTSAGENETSTLYGTSFAAPELSYQEALYLLKNGSVSCTGSEGTKKSSPPLKYVSAPPAGAGAYLDLPLDQAAAQWCTDFPLPTPTP